MKILMVNKFLYPRGGAEIYFLKLGEYLEKKGHEVQYFGMYDEKNTVGNRMGSYTQNMDFHGAGIAKFLYPLKIIYSFEAYKKISKVIKDFKPDIIHLNNVNYQLTPSVIDAADKLGVPMVETVHDFQMVCPNHALFHSKSKSTCEACLEGSTRNCVHKKCIHDSLIKSILGAIETIVYRNKNTYKKVSTYICPSCFMEEKLLTNKLLKGKTKVIQNFIELPDDSHKYEKQNYVLYFGRLSEEKGIKIFVEACKKLPDIDFKIAGSGPMEDICKDISNVDYVGFKTGEDLTKLIAEARLCVYPSIWYENCPLSILESISLGTPVITTGWGGMKELVKENETGKLVLPMNADNLARAVRELYNNERELMRMSKNCLKEREKMITIDKYCELLMDIYEQTKAEK